MKILSIDPGSNRVKKSTSGVALLDGPNLIGCWSVENGIKGLQEWLDSNADVLSDVDEVICELYEIRSGDASADNSTKETMDWVVSVLGAIPVRNAGYKSTITDDLLKLLDLWKFDVKTNHNDIREACRLGLFYQAKIKDEAFLRRLYQRVKQAKT